MIVYNNYRKLQNTFKKGVMTVNTQTKNGLGKIEETLQSIIQFISAKKGEKTVVLDMREFPVPTDFFVIAEGDNPKHVKAIAENMHILVDQDIDLIKNL